MTTQTVGTPKPDRKDSGTPPSPKRRARRLGMFVLFLGLLALTAPLLAGEYAARRVGIVLVVAGLIEAYDGFRRTNDALQRAAWQSGFVSLLMGGIVLGADDIRAAALVVLLGAMFVVDAARYLVIGVRERRPVGPAPWYAPVIGNLAVAGLVFLLRGEALVVTVAIAAAFRTLGTGWSMLYAAVRTSADAGGAALDDLRLTDHPEAQAVARSVAETEATRSSYDREWILGFAVTLFAIHLGRMGLDRTVLGIVSPLVAVFGDLFIALIAAFLVVFPARLAFRRMTRGLEVRGWERLRTEPATRAGRAWNGVIRWWIKGRLRLAIRIKRTRYQPLLAIRRGLQVGLPIAAAIAATFPVWGMSWFFDTENWATGMWNSYAEARTDTWREAMVRAVSAALPVGHGAQAFAVAPPGVPASGDFSFIVIGDTGEGDASQHILRDSLIEASSQQHVRFVVLSSDVIYPTGAMKDYENKFWLPFKGVKKPVYAIPGNHDWYDALDGFAATFFEPAAAKAAIRARTESDGRLSSTTDSRIDEYVAESARLGHEYGVPVAGQRAPFFQFQTDGFALLAIDTGVAKRIDETQRRWLEDALEAARGKFIMAVVGHPFYAAGADQTEGYTDFAILHQMLRRHGVNIAMAGDTHDLEYYVEHYERASKPQTMYHWVNGGGGAYLSYGTSLSWPATPATPTWMYYPGKAAVYGKIESTTPLWKRPAWFWTKQLDAWPFTPEWLSGMFDSNQAPFFQSFVEVRVEPSARRVRLLPWGINGRLRWSDVDASPDARPPGTAADAPIEWVVPWPEAKP